MFLVADPSHRSVLFYSAQISLHKFRARNSSASRAIYTSAADSIVALLKTFRAQFGLKHASLPFIYAAVLATHAILAQEQEAKIADTLDGRLSFLIQALKEMEDTWTLAGHMAASLQDVYSRFNFPLFFQLLGTFANFWNSRQTSPAIKDGCRGVYDTDH
jgi:hypothetical protein